MDVTRLCDVTCEGCFETGCFDEVVRVLTDKGIVGEFQTVIYA